MQYARFHINTPLQFISCGKFVSRDHWTHPRRVLNSYVLLLGIEGNVHIQQGAAPCVLTPGSTMVLLPNTEHFGYRADENVSYYWCHFQCDSGHTILPAWDDLRFRQEGESAFAAVSTEPQRIASDNGKVMFRQLLHTVERIQPHDRMDAMAPPPFLYQAHYLLTSLALEISDQLMTANLGGIDRGKAASALYEALEWMRINGYQNITLQSLSQRFHYNSEYFSRIFRQYMGQTLTQYITAKRMEKARDYLLNTKLSVKEIAYAVGFNDEKHFMKTFKTYEGLTPTMYRNTVYYTHLNNQ